MRKTNIIFGLFAAVFALFVFSGCSKEDNASKMEAKTGSFDINFFRDATTTNPECFVDFYNLTSYTQSGAKAHAATIDAFVYDRSRFPVSSTDVVFQSMKNFGLGAIDGYTQFDNVVGAEAFTAYNPSTFAPVSITAVDFNNIRYNDDIAAIFAAKALNDGYEDMSIPAVDLGLITKYYYFRCFHNGKRGFFRVISSNYASGNNMRIEVKVEKWF